MRLIAFTLVSLGILLLPVLSNPGGIQAQTAGSDPVGSPNPDCFKQESSIYNTTGCQEWRNSESGKKYQKQLCDERKPEGAVWVVFASQCVTFVEFGPIIISYLLTFSSIIAGVMFVVASFKYLSSKGDPSALADARDMMINAAVGMVLIASAYAIVVVLNDAFGFAGGAINLLPFFEFNPI